MTEERESGIALKFERVTVAFDGKPALSDISFEVPAGQTRILFGAAGSGKTVLLKTALGLLKPDKGRVSVFGRDITDMGEEELFVGSSRVDLQACKLEYSIVSPK